MDLSDPRARFDVVSIYRGLVERVPDLFDKNTQATSHVVGEITAFIEQRMAVLMGVERTPEQQAVLDEILTLNIDDVRKLKALAQGNLQPARPAAQLRRPQETPQQAVEDQGEVPQVNYAIDREEVAAVRAQLEQHLFEQHSFVKEERETPHIEAVQGTILDLFDKLETIAPMARIRMMREALAPGSDTWKFTVIDRAVRMLITTHLAKIPRPSELAGYTDEALRRTTPPPKAQTGLRALSPQAAAAVTSERANEESSIAENRFMAGAQAGTLRASGGENNV